MASPGGPPSLKISTLTILTTNSISLNLPDADNADILPALKVLTDKLGA